jgi:hypothetical protein
LVYCVPEGERLVSRTYRCLNIWNDRRVSIGDVRFVPSGREDLWNPVIKEHNERERLHLAVSGQPLVVGGKPINPYKDLEAADGFVDIRHLVVSPFPHLLSVAWRSKVSQRQAGPLEE